MSEDSNDDSVSESQRSFLKAATNNELPLTTSVDIRPNCNSESDFLNELCDKMDKKKREALEIAHEN